MGKKEKEFKFASSAGEDYTLEVFKWGMAEGGRK